MVGQSNIKISEKDIARFINVLKEYSNYDLSNYSIKSLTRRVAFILEQRRLDIDHLIERLRVDHNFREKILKDITVNTTELFRDPNIWKRLRSFLPEYFSHLEGKELKIWHAGVSSGQELYSMEIILDLWGRLDNTLIFGTDINEDILEVAKRGVYHRFDFDESLNNIRRVFDSEYQRVIDTYFIMNDVDNTYVVKPILKEYPIFLKHDLVNDGNIFGTKFHIIVCRNVMIYFNYRLQNSILNFFYENLYSKGLLIIGSHEGVISEAADKFNKDGCFYKKHDRHLEVEI